MRAGATVGWLAIALSTTSCTLLPFGGFRTSGPARLPSPMGHGLLELRAAFHVHGYLSHDSRGSIDAIAHAARSLGIDTVILSDHYAPGNISRAARGMQGGVLFVPGVELNAGKTGSILSFDLKEDFSNKKTPAERTAEMARQGAVSVYGHCEELEDWSLEPFQGFEVYNLHAEFKAQSVWSLVWRLLFLPADAFFEAAVTEPTRNLATYDRELARGRHLAALAGHDAHANIRVFGPLGGTIGTYPEILRLFSNHLLVREWSVEGVGEAVRAGRTFVVFDYLGDGTGFELSYGAPNATADERAILGDAVRHDPDARLEVRIPETTRIVPRIRTLQDGKEISSVETRRLCMPLDRPGIVRVEVYLGKRLWIVSSPIYITASAPGSSRSPEGNHS